MQHWLENKFDEDVINGVCNHNLYIYRDAQKIYESDPSIEFEDALKIASIRRCGCEKEFPSRKELEQKGLTKEVKVTRDQHLDVLSNFYNNGGIL